MGGACNMHGRDEKMRESFGLKTRRDDTTWMTWAWMGG